MLTFTKIFNKFEDSLQAFTHVDDVKKIQKLIGEKCVKFPINDDTKLQAPETYQADDYRIGCRFQSMNYYIRTLNDREISLIWNKYASSLAQQVSGLEKCSSK